LVSVALGLILVFLVAPGLSGDWETGISLLGWGLVAFGLVSLLFWALSETLPWVGWLAGIVTLVLAVVLVAPWVIDQVKGDKDGEQLANGQNQPKLLCVKQISFEQGSKVHVVKGTGDCIKTGEKFALNLAPGKGNVEAETNLPETNLTLLRVSEDGRSETKLLEAKTDEAGKAKFEGAEFVVTGESTSALNWLKIAYLQEQAFTFAADVIKTFPTGNVTPELIGTADEVARSLGATGVAPNGTVPRGYQVAADGTSSSTLVVTPDAKVDPRFYAAVKEVCGLDPATATVWRVINDQDRWQVGQGDDGLYHRSNQKIPKGQPVFLLTWANGATCFINPRPHRYRSTSVWGRTWWMSIRVRWFTTTTRRAYKRHRLSRCRRQLHTLRPR
jgi:hypothetical protein